MSTMITIVIEERLTDSYCIHRHGESEWNVTDPARNLTARFTGWVDVNLTEKGREQARAAGKCLEMFHISPSAVYTSLLRRSIDSFNEMHLKNFENMSIINSWRLNERHYGALTGISKSSAAVRFGQENLTSWRRSWNQAPPPLHWEDSMDMSAAISARPTTVIHEPGKINIVAIEKQYRAPATESLQDCANRVIPLWLGGIVPRIRLGETVLVVAHANSIRSILKYIERDSITDISVRNINIPSAIPLIYDFVAEEDDEVASVEEKRLTNRHPIVRLHPVGVPSSLGIRGKYVISKEVLKLHLGSHQSRDKDLADGSDKFYELIEKDFQDIIKYADEGGGKSDALIVTDGNGYIIHANEAWSQLCGFSREEILGKTISFLQGPLTSSEDVSRLNEKLQTGLPAIGQILNYRKSGRAIVNEYTVLPIYDWLRDGVILKPDITNVPPRPSHFIAKLTPTLDKIDVKPLTPDEMRLRDGEKSVRSMSLESSDHQDRSSVLRTIST